VVDFTERAVLLNGDFADSVATDGEIRDLFLSSVRWAGENGGGYVGELEGATAGLTSNGDGQPALDFVDGSAAPTQFTANSSTFEVAPAGTGHPVLDNVALPHTSDDMEFAAAITGADPATVLATYDNGNPAILATVDPNRPPVATDASVTTAEDTPVSIALEGTDPDGDPVTATVTTLPAHGTFAGGTYTPDANYHGPDSIEFSVSDGNGGTDTGTITITVTPVEDPPVATDASVTTAEDTPVSIAPAGTDPDGDTLTVTVTTPPTHGTFVGGTYTPAADYHGPDSIDFNVDDGHGGSDSGTITITVTPVNDPPTATDASVSVAEDGSVAITPTGTDPDGDSLTVTVTTPPQHGTFTGGTYTPNTNYHGPDSIVFSVDDSHGGLDSGTITITITPVNDPPVAVAKTYDADENTPLTKAAPGLLTGDSDADGDPLTASPGTDPANGSVAIQPDGAFTYTPNPGFAGSDSFTYQVSDGIASATGSVTIRVHPFVPDPNAPCTINGTAANNTITGTPGNDVICAGAGNDSISGLGGHDVIRTGPGADSTDGGPGNDYILGEAGNDTGLGGAAGDDTILGGTGNDKLIGEAGVDDLQGGDGRDWLLGDAGDDLINGGAERDKVDYKNSPTAVEVNLLSSSAVGEGSDTLSSIEIVTGSAYPDHLTGSNGDDDLNGYRGNDLIEGLDGDDFIDGGPNTDTCYQGGVVFGGTMANCEAGDPPAAPAAARTATFTRESEVLRMTVTLSPGSSSFNAIFSWTDEKASFGVARAEILPAGRVKRPVRVKLQVRRGDLYVSVRGKLAKRFRTRGTKLRFALRANSLDGRTAVRTTVAQRPG
jgi:Ca2+-binding RTX toxin-like protein